MKLLQKDYEKMYKEQLAEVNCYSWSTVKRTKANTDITFQHQNNYEVLKNIEDDETTENNKELMRRSHEDSQEELDYNDELMTKNRKNIHEGIESQINQPNSSKCIKQSQRAEEDRNNHRQDKLNQRQNLPKQRQRVTIVGDSMIKYLSPMKLQRNSGVKVQVKTFPCARLEEMTHYIKPNLKSPPECIGLHVGTNDVKFKSSQEISAHRYSLRKNRSRTQILVLNLLFPK